MGARQIPDWAEVPLAQAEAAKALGMSYRAFYDLLRVMEHGDQPICEYRGKGGSRRVFYSEQIALLRDLQCRRKPKRKPPGPRPGTKTSGGGSSTSTSMDRELADAYKYFEELRTKKRSS